MIVSAHSVIAVYRQRIEAGCRATGKYRNLRQRIDVLNAIG